jgi:undecaprenyl pyrophosphate phosphatase UppP
MKNTYNFKKGVIVLEVIFATILILVFGFYVSKKVEYPYKEIFIFVFTLMMLLILITEWMRRKVLKENRPKYEKYIYIPLMFLMLLFGIWFISLFDFDPNFI